MGQLDQAEALLGESLERKRTLGDGRGMAATLSNLGLVAADRDDLALAHARRRRRWRWTVPRASAAPRRTRSSTSVA